VASQYYHRSMGLELVLLLQPQAHMTPVMDHSWYECWLREIGSFFEHLSTCSWDINKNNSWRKACLFTPISLLLLEPIEVVGLLRTVVPVSWEAHLENWVLIFKWTLLPQWGTILWRDQTKLVGFQQAWKLFWELWWPKIILIANIESPNLFKTKQNKTE
jgi:hypothetical protein